MRTNRFVVWATLAVAMPAFAIDLELVGRYAVPPPEGETFADAVFDQGAAEIVAHHSGTQRLFVVNGASDAIDVIGIANPAAPSLLFSIVIDDHCPAGASCGGANSVDVHGDLVAVAVEADPKTDPGFVFFFDVDGHLLRAVVVGAQPDMITFTPDGKFVLTANEGEPSGYGADDVDPVGSISVIRLSGKSLTHRTGVRVRTAGFEAFDAPGAVPPGVRVFGPGATASQDLEPEYIAVSADSRTAWVTIQEANALAVVDVKRARIVKLVALGLKDHSVTGAGLDPTDNDGIAEIGPWPVKGMYMPDAIAAFRDGKRGETYLAMVNEGDVREWPGFSTPCFGPSTDEAIEVRTASYVLDPTAFPNAADLKVRNNMGDLKASRASGDLDGDCDFDEIHSFGARSLSVRDASGAILWDSGDVIEQATKAALPASFNASSTNNTLDNRSDDKGPEPEALAVGEAHGRRLAFAGLERIGGIMVFDLTEPSSPALLTYVNDRDFTKAPDSGEAKDLGPEGIHFISAAESPNGSPMIAVANEVSGTTSLFAVVDSE